MKFGEYNRISTLSSDRLFLVDGPNANTETITALSLAENVLSLLTNETDLLKNYHRVLEFPNGVSNADNLTENGIYAVFENSGISNLPSEAGSGYLKNIVLTDNLKYMFQEFHQSNENAVYQRKKAAGIWGSWVISGFDNISSRLDVKMNFINGEETIDLDDCRTQGFYKYPTDVSHNPHADRQGMIWVLPYSNKTCYQVAFPVFTNTTSLELWFRRYYNGSWTPWKEITLTAPSS